MTIKLLTPRGAIPINAIITLDAATEASLVGEKVASTDLTGGFVWTGPVDRSTAPADQAYARASAVSGAGNVARYIGGVKQEQLAETTKPVTKFGQLACRFGAGMWSVTAGSPTVTQGYTGWDGSGGATGAQSRSGMPDMLRVVPAANTTEQITLNSFAANMLTKLLSGKFCLEVKVENQPGYGTGGGAGTIAVEIGTNADQTAPLIVTFTPSQIREGDNHLTFVMRNPAAYVDGNPDVEYHPYGVLASNFGTGANSNIKDNPAAYIKISWDNMLGAALTFVAIWTGFETQPQALLGCDGGVGLEELAVPLMDSYGWVGYVAQPYRVWSSGSKVVTNMDGGDATSVAQAVRLVAKGWEWVNHTMNHLANGTLTSEGEIAYEVQMAQAWQYEADAWRGSEFYASPQSSTSRLSEKVIKALGFKAQRHLRHWNIQPMSWGLDNPHHLGALDISSAGGGSLAYSLVTGGTPSSVTGLQQYSKLVRVLDVAEAYGATIMPFWHGVTQTGDTGSGEDLTGDTLIITYSALRMFFAELRRRELTGTWKVLKGFSELIYGRAG